MEMETPTKREIPMIAGSSAAFIAVIVVLACITIVSCTAVVYILREEMSQDEQAGGHRTRDRYGRPRRAALLGSLARALRLSGAREETNLAHPGKPRGGWMEAGNASEWDLERNEENSHLYLGKMAPVRMESVGSLRSSLAPSLPPSSRIYIPGGAEYESHPVRGSGYATPYPRHSIIPSIQSQPYSPPSSVSSPLARHAALSSSESIQGLSLTHADSVDNTSIPNAFIDPPTTSVKAINSGSKFVEGL